MANCQSGVYEIVNLTNGKRYVGSAVDIGKRFRTHRANLNLGKHHSPILQNAWKKYGVANFRFAPVLTCIPADLVMFEQIAMDALRPQYNIAPRAGSCLGVVRTEAFKKKISKAFKGTKRPAIGDALRGSVRGPMSDAAKAKLSASKKGKSHGPCPATLKAKLSAILKGRKPSAKTIEASAASKRGKKQSPETIAKRVAAVIGQKRQPYKKHSAEANARKSEALKGNSWNVGYKHSTQARANMGAAQSLRRSLEKSSDGR